MYDTLSESGVDVFVAWFARLFGEDFATYTFEEYPGVEFMIRDVAHTIHEMLQINDNYGYDMQSFLDLIQRTGCLLFSSVNEDTAFPHFLTFCWCRRGDGHYVAAG
jgi:hypothetical protein